MTLPTLTYGNDFEEPCTDASIYTETEDGNTATLTVTEGGIFDINVTNSAGNKICYYKLTTAISVSSNVYGKITFRYKTSDSNIKAKIVLTFSSGSQTVLDETSNTSWTVDTVDITASKTIQYISFYATQATGHVYYDFALIHKETFTIPNFDNLIFENQKRDVHLGIPSRGGDASQDLGIQSSDIMIDGTMQSGETWGSTLYPYGEYLLEAYRNDTFCWFTSDMVNCLVMVTRVRLGQEKASGQQRTFRVELKYYAKSDVKASTWDGRAWLGK